jgi:energy-coupling factor transporter transmembrane protein EcfT
VESLLKPFPFIPRKRVALMMGLLLRFLPLILSAARETADAQRARAIENRRNPVYRMVKLIIPLMRRAFLEADRLATAMEARCYTEDRVTPPIRTRSGDWVFLAAVSILSIAAPALTGF